MSNYLLLENLVLIVFAIFLGGIVKGSVGIGMSMFSVPIIAFILPPTKAMMLLCFPVIFTNFLQMDIKKGVGSFRFLPMFLALFLGLLIGGKLILNLSFNFISISIATVIIIFTSLNFFGINLKNLKKVNVKILSVIIGFFSGILGGLTTFYAPPIITFLISAALGRFHSVCCFGFGILSHHATQGRGLKVAEGLTGWRLCLHGAGLNLPCAATKYRFGLGRQDS